MNCVVTNILFFYVKWMIINWNVSRDQQTTGLSSTRPTIGVVNMMLNDVWQWIDTNLFPKDSDTLFASFEWPSYVATSNIAFQKYKNAA